MAHSSTNRVRVKLGALHYEVPALNLGQQRRLLALTAQPLDRENTDALLGRGFEVATLIFERAEPAIDDLEALECSLAELRAATDAVQVFSGMLMADAGKQTAAA